MDFQLKNLVLLGGSYDQCKSNKISKVMKEFEQKKLKDRNNKIINNRKQALAIALSMGQTKCKISSTDADKIIEKVNQDLNQTDKKIILSNLVETRQAIEQLLKNGQTKRVYIFKNLLWDKIIDSQRNNEKLDLNMWDEIKKIHQLK